MKLIEVFIQYVGIAMACTTFALTIYLTADASLATALHE